MRRRPSKGLAGVDVLSTNHHLSYGGVRNSNIAFRKLKIEVFARPDDCEPQLDQTTCSCVSSGRFRQSSITAEEGFSDVSPAELERCGLRRT